MSVVHAKFLAQDALSRAGRRCVGVSGVFRVEVVRGLERVPVLDVFDGYASV